MRSISYEIGVSFADDIDYTSTAGLVPVFSLAPSSDINSILSSSTDAAITISFGTVPTAVAVGLVLFTVGQSKKADGKNEYDFH